MDPVLHKLLRDIQGRLILGVYNLDRPFRSHDFSRQIEVKLDFTIIDLVSLEKVFHLFLVRSAHLDRVPVRKFQIEFTIHM